jgi:hypothetical protein
LLYFRGETITSALKKGDKGSLIGFGTFDVAKRAAREGVNPQTRQKIKIKASKAPRFKAGKARRSSLFTIFSPASVKTLKSISWFMIKMTIMYVKYQGCIGR